MYVPWCYFRMWMEGRDRARRTRAGSVVHSMKGRAGRCHGQADGVGVEVQVPVRRRAAVLECQIE